MLVINQSFSAADGIARCAIHIAEGLNDRGHDVVLVHQKDPYKPELLDRWHSIATCHTVNVVSPTRRQAARSAVGLVETAALIRRSRPDVVHVHRRSHVAAAIAGSGRARPVVAHLHGPTRRVNYGRAVGLARVNSLIAVSESVAQSWVGEGFDRKLITVVRNGIDLSRFLPVSSRTAAQARQQLGLGVGGPGPVIGFLGRFAESKGLDILARAFRLVVQELPAAHLVLVGTPDSPTPLSQELRRLLADQPVTWVPVRPDPELVMAAFDIGVVPSQDEGFSNVVLEMMATQIPVVATRVGGNPEAFGSDLDRFLVNFGDVEGLAAAIVSAHRESTPSLREAFRARAELFSTESMVTGVETVLTDAVQAHRQSRTA